MYKVIRSFADLQDNGHKYNVGDDFPRAGLDVSDARINKLAGNANRQRTPLIEKVKDTPLDDIKPSSPTGLGATPKVREPRARKNRKKD